MIQREEIIGNCRLLLGNCVDILPTLKNIDAVVMDPPYGIGFKYGDKYSDNGGQKYIELLSCFNHKPCVVLQYPEEMIELVVPAMGLPTKIVSWCYNSNTARQHRQWGFFKIKPDFSALKFKAKNLTDKRVAEFVSSYDWWSDIQQVKNVSGEKTDHPCQVPIELVRRVLAVIPQAQNILDPFLGSGTTAIAAMKTGRKFTGIEIQPEYFDIASERVNKAYEQRDMFVEEPKLKQVEFEI